MGIQQDMDRKLLENICVAVQKELKITSVVAFLCIFFTIIIYTIVMHTIIMYTIIMLYFQESDYFTPQGEFRVDAAGSPILLNCLMYKMCYHRFGEMQVSL